MMNTRGALAAAALGLMAQGAAAEPQPVESFARMPQMRDPVISSDGHFVAFVSSMDDASVVMTFDRQTNSPFQRIAASEPGRFDVDRCNWANAERLVCSLTGNIRGRNYAEQPFFRTMAVDAVGTKMKTLDVQSEKGNLLAAKTTPQNFNAGTNVRATDSKGGTTTDGGTYSTLNAYGAKGRTFEYFSGQRSDQIIGVKPGDYEHVLIQADNDGNYIPSVFALNVYTGGRTVVVRQNPPIRQFVADAQGDVRLGWGMTGRLNAYYFARTDEGNDWRPLERANAFAKRQPLVPIGIDSARDSAYAVSEHEGRKALWSIDLRDQSEPAVVFSQPRADLDEPMLTNDRRLFGMSYDLERPAAHYTDENLRNVMDKINKQFPTSFHTIVDMTRDEETLVVRSSSDVDDGSYYLFNRTDKKLKRLGAAYPELKPEGLGVMKPITYKAADGTDIPGYLTIPNGVKAEKLPLIVLPHDGPTARDTFRFSFLRTFLANRGYAVLQMNYRGSSGYGQSWKDAAKEGWSGVVYSDITDATRWAIAQGIADPKRVCIAGWGFGGYAALLGAARNSDLYKCSISINGFSDLVMLRENARLSGPSAEALLIEQIGSDKEKLTRDSPVEHADSVGIPVLLVHGDLDWRVQIDQTKKMASALKRQKKDHKAVFIKGAGHDLDRKSDRMTLLNEVEQFLQKNLGPGARAGA
jgi:dipeptidyl aminopeptidase/acylaminoacyl peptidase